MENIDPQIAAQNKTIQAVRSIASLLILSMLSALLGGVVTLIGWVGVWAGNYSSLEYSNYPLKFLANAGPVVAIPGIAVAVIVATKQWLDSAP